MVFLSSKGLLTVNINVMISVLHQNISHYSVITTYAAHPFPELLNTAQLLRLWHSPLIFSLNKWYKYS